MGSPSLEGGSSDNLWGKIVDNAAIGTVKAKNGITSGADKVGKMGTTVCKWIFAKGEGVVKAASEKYNEVVAKRSQHNKDVLTKHSEIKGKNLSGASDVSEIEGDELEDATDISDSEIEGDELEDEIDEEFEDDAVEHEYEIGYSESSEETSKSKFAEFRSEAGHAKDKAKAKLDQFRDGIGAKLDEYEETQKLKEISIAGKNAIVGFVKFVYKAPGKMMDSIENRAGKAEDKRISDELKKMQQ